MESRTSDSQFLLVIAVVLTVGVAAIVAAIATPSGGYYEMMGGVGWVWGSLMMAAFALILVVVVFALVVALRQPSAAVPYAAYAPVPKERFGTPRRAVCARGAGSRGLPKDPRGPCWEVVPTMRAGVSGFLWSRGAMFR